MKYWITGCIEVSMSYVDWAAGRPKKKLSGKKFDSDSSGNQENIGRHWICRKETIRSC
jgi:hypothetical protein